MQSGAGTCSRCGGAVRLLVAGIAALTVPLAAQVPGVPVLQNAFSMPGIAIAANFGGGSGQSYYGAAAAWGPGSGRIQLSAGAGAQRTGGTTRGAYGGRGAFSVWSSAGGALGLGAFAGFGGAPSTKTNGIVSSAAVIIVPLGASIGYRRTLGSRGMSVYLSPMYLWTRADKGTVVASGGTFAAAAGLDFAFSSSLGATVGGQIGQPTVAMAPGTRAGSIGVAVSFVPGRR